MEALIQYQLKWLEISLVLFSGISRKPPDKGQVQSLTVGTES